MRTDLNIEPTGVRGAVKYRQNPFIDEVFKLSKGKTTLIAGSTKEILVDSETGETKGIGMLHRYKEVDKDHFVKIFVKEVSSLFDLSKSGLKAFGYILTIMPINKDEIFIHMPDLLSYCGWTSYASAYKGLGELMANKIIAMSEKHGHWFVNPNIIFNGDRIAFIKEYRLKQPIRQPRQLNAFIGADIDMD